MVYGGKHEEIIEVKAPDDASQKEILELANEAFDTWRWNYIDSGWDFIKEDDE